MELSGILALLMTSCLLVPKASALSIRPVLDGVAAFTDTATAEMAEKDAQYADCECRVKELEDEINDLKLEEHICTDDYSDMAFHEVNNGLGYEYLLSKTKLSWYDARAFCYGRRYSLASVESQDELSYVQGLLRTQAIDYAVWVDGTDDGHENCWVWTFEKVRPASFIKWGEASQPDNAGDAEHCLDLHKRLDFTFNDLSCNYNTEFLCKRKKNTDALAFIAITDAIKADGIC